MSLVTRILIKFVTYLVLTFLLVVLFDNGPENYGAGVQRTADELIKFITTGNWTV